MQLKDLECIKYDNKISKLFIQKHHYTGTCGNMKISYAFLYNGYIKSCITYSMPVGRSVISSLWPSNGNTSNTLELTRMFSYDDMPKNMESYCISQSIKHLKIDLPNVELLVSYADTGAGHVGYIYQASNWIYTGHTGNEKKIFINGKREHRRTLYSRYGTSSIPKLKDLLGEDIEVYAGYKKYRYIYPIRKSKSQHKKLMNELVYKPQEYPKGDLKYYDKDNNTFNMCE